MFHPRDGERIVELGESLGESASGNPSATWGVGVGVALGLAVYATVCLARQSAMFLGEHAVTTHQGSQAIALGVSYLALAGFLHAHFFWSWRSRWMGYAQIAKAVTMLVAAGGILFFAFNALIFK